MKRPVINYIDRMIAREYHQSMQMFKHDIATLKMQREINRIFTPILDFINKLLTKKY